MIKKESMIDYCKIVKLDEPSLNDVFFNLNEYGRSDNSYKKITFNGILYKPNLQLWTSQGPSSIIAELYKLAKDRNFNINYKIITIFGAESNDNGVTIHCSSIGVPKNG